MLQRDSFIEEIFSCMKKNKNIFFLSADFGAQSLDKIRKNFPKNFIHCGISEQAMLDVATGLALEKKIVFVYAMAPFLSLRALEQIKCGPGMMNLPITILSVGVGLGYADSGPTHYANEDFACVRAILGNTIYTLSSSDQAKSLAKKIINKPHFSYIRFDRDILPILSKSQIKIKTIKNTFNIIGDINKNKILLISHGKTTHIAIEAVKKNYEKFYMLDLIQSKPFPKKALSYLKENRGIIVIDEQNISGSLASCIFEECSINKIINNIKIICLPNKYIFENGGRDFLLNKFNISYKGILSKYREFHTS